MTVSYIKQNKLVNLSDLLIDVIRENNDIRAYGGHIEHYARDVLSVLALVCANEIYALEQIADDTTKKKTRKKMKEYLMKRIDYAFDLREKVNE